MTGVTDGSGCGGGLDPDDPDDPDDPGVTGGTYVLVVTVPHAVTIEAGALGEHRVGAGAYGYVGSALGTGGFARVERHRELAAGERAVRHWHVDSLLGHPDATLVDAVRLGGVAVECDLARALLRRETPPIRGFGASDCDCPGHLVRRSDADALRGAIDDALATL